MLEENKTQMRYNIVVKNKPGELVKLTKFLSDANMNVSALRVIDRGSKADIQFSTPRGCNLIDGLRKTGLRAQAE